MSCDAPIIRIGALLNFPKKGKYMFYVISDGVPGSDGPPFLFYKFKDLRVASKAMGVLANPEMLCNLVVYNDDSLESLKENYSKELIDSIWQSFGLKDCAEIEGGRWDNNKGFPNHNTSCLALHSLVKKKAKLYSDQYINQIVENKMEVNEEKPKVTQPKSSNGFDPSDVIVALVKEPTPKVGTNRHRNQQVILESKNLAEALDKLRNLNPSPGSLKDVKIAIEAKAIELRPANG